jgi:hypothetical protein
MFFVQQISIDLIFWKVCGSIEKMKRSNRPRKLSACAMSELSCVVCVDQ